MNFTREPIIETIITPREGFKLVVRSTKGVGQEEYNVDAIEVVSFGQSFFFRSLERPKSFLVPVSDYEVVEVKETRVVLKSVSIEKTIKIGGGREASFKAPKEPSGEPQVAEAGSKKGPQEQRPDKKRERRRHRRRKGGGTEEGKEAGAEQSPATPSDATETVAAEPQPQGGESGDEAKTSSSMFSRLFPPPPSLISETLTRDKKKEEEAAGRDASAEEVAPKEKAGEEEPRKKSPEEPLGGESQELQRVGQSAESTASSFFRIFLP